MSEIWKPVAGYEGLYEVSSEGRVRSLDWATPMISKWGTPTVFHTKGRVLRGDASATGHRRVELSKNGSTRRFLVHRLVACAFLPNPQDLPVVNHLDSNPSNNTVENLEWTTHSGNSRHASSTGRMRATTNPNLRQKLTPETVAEIRAEYARRGNMTALAKRLGVSTVTVNNVARGKTWRRPAEDGQHFPNTRLSLEERLEIGRRVLNKESVESLSAELGWSRSVLFNCQKLLKNQSPPAHTP